MPTRSARHLAPSPAPRQLLSTPEQLFPSRRRRALHATTPPLPSDRELVVNETDPEPESDTVTLNVLATELCTRVRILLAWADWANITIVDPRTGAVTAESADHLRMLHAMDPGGPPKPDPAPTHTLIAHQLDDYDPQIAAMERNLNVPWHRRQGARSRRRPAPPRRRELELTGTAAAARRQWPTMAAEPAQQISATWTGHYLFSDTDAAAWWAAGVHYTEIELAHVLACLGIEPWMIKLEINKDSMLWKLRNGLAPEQAAQLLRRHGHLDNAG